jgi:hypothetical protein
MQYSTRNLIIGFFAGALAVLFFHQTLIAIYAYNGIIPAKPWNNAPTGPFGVPTIINSMFWGGVWGIVYAAIMHKFPAKFPIWLKGLVFALLLPLMFAWFVLPFIKNTPLMSGGKPIRMLISASISGAFGIGTAWIMCFIKSRLNLRA